MTATIDTSAGHFLYCNRCHSGTQHAERGNCKKVDKAFDEASRTTIHFAETYSLLQCLVCGQARMQVVLWNSESDESSAQVHPPPEIRRPPTWVEHVERPLRAALMDVYTALNAGMHAIALMGVRSLLDVWVSSNTSNDNNFGNKLAQLVALGTLSARQVELLNATFDAGSAAIHRGYTPSKVDTLSALEAVENLLQQQHLVPKIEALKGNTPTRRR